MKKIFIILLLSMLTVSNFSKSTHAETVSYELDFGETSQTIMSEVFELMKDVNLLEEAEKIDALTKYFLEIPYVANRLVGSNSEKEKLVIALDELDCFTYIDYVESFKRSHDEASFIENLKKIRYINGDVNYLSRKHFFSDWFGEDQVIVEDVLKQEQYKDIVDIKTVSLNQGASGVYIPGLEVRERDIYSIPRDKVDEAVLSTLKTGDYVGLATSIAGLDVTHTVIVIQKDDGTYMRHASSQKANMKVVDEKIIDYVNRMSSVRGLLVFRSLSEMKPLESIININYLDTEGNKIQESSDEIKLIGETYNFEAPQINGYTVSDTTKTLTGNVTDFETTLNFVYSKNPVNTNGNYDLDFGETSQTIMSEVFELMKDVNLLEEAEKIDALTKYFLEIPYVANRLVGSNSEKEKLVIALDELDCFTYIDYVESFKRSHDEASFIENLKKIRYINGDVNYLSRKHFFSDWFGEDQVIVEDVLKQEQYKDIVDIKTVSLNQGASGVYIPGLEVRERDIYSIPRDKVDEAVLSTLKTGDYVGLATSIAGLDVTHTVIVIQKDDGTYMRHASSQKANMKVVDEKIIDYVNRMSSVRGLLVFRSLSEMKPLESIININYLDTEGNKIQESSNEIKLIGETYNFEAPQINGYTVSDSTKTLTGDVTDFETTLNFVYSKNPTDIVEEKPEEVPSEKPSETPNVEPEKLPQTGTFAIYSLLGASSTIIASSLAMINRKRNKKQ